MRSVYKVLAAVCASAAMIGLAGQAQAASWLVSYTATANPSPFSADLTVTTGDIANLDGSYAVTAIGGTVDNGGGHTDMVSGIIDNGNPNGWSYSLDGKFMFDNLLFPTAAPAGPSVSWYGLMFSGASGDEYNLFSDNASTYEFYRANPHVGGYLANSYGTVSVSAAQVPGVQSFGRSSGGAVPEPAAWLSMIVGFGAAAAIRRQRRASTGAV